MNWVRGLTPDEWHWTPMTGHVRFVVQERDREDEPGREWVVKVLDQDSDEQFDAHGGLDCLHCAVALCKAYAQIGDVPHGPSQMVRAIDRAFGVPAGPACSA